MKNRIFSSPFSRLPLSYLLLPFLTLFAGSIASAQIPSSGLVGYWPFNGNANDESGNGNNGTVNGTTLTTDRFGNASSAYNFDGVNDFIDAGSFYNFGTANFTVSCWFKLVPTSANASLVSKREVNMQGNWWVQEVNGFQIDESAQSSILTLTHPTPLNKQLWTNYIIIREGNILSFYVNGVLSDQETLPTAYNMSNNANLLFGTTFVDGSYVGLLKGKLDDISIYNRAIDSEEISSLFTTTTSTVATPPCPTLATNLQTGLVGYWPFCGNANDESGNGNNGTVNGATLTTDRFGNANSAYSFDGVNDWIEVLHSVSLSFPSSTQTISFWIQIPSSPTPPVLESVMSKYSGSGSSLTGFTVHFTLESLFYSIKNGWASNSWGDCFLPTTSLTPYNNFKHVVFSNDNDSLRCYVDGVHVSSSNLLSGVLLGQNIYPLVFGKENEMAYAGGLSFFYGKLDDICIWNRALSPAEITQLYTDPSTTPPIACTPFLGEDQTVCAGTSVTLSASGSSLACPTLPSTLQNGLVGYWPFCGNANDASGNGNNGTVNGATLTTDRFSNANSAYGLSGASNSILVNDSPSLDFPQGVFSLCAEVKLNGLGVEQGLIDHLDVGGPSVLSRYTLRVLPNNKVRFNLKDDENDWSSVDSDISLDVNVWYSIVGVFNYTTQELHIYINGEIHDGTIIYNNLTGPAITPPNSLYIGNFAGAYNLNGTIDNVSIYNRSLSATEIQQLYTLGQLTYLWSTGATTATIIVTPTATTTYTCTVTDANGNVCTDSVTVFVPQIEATDLTICAGETTTLSVSGINSTATPSACPTLPTNLQTGLVGYWPFCGNANDASGNGNNGTVNGATLTTDRFGNANSAYSFDGDDFIGMLATPELPACTINLFYKLNSVSDPSGFGALFSSNWYSFMHLQVGLENGSNQGVAAYPNPDSPISCVIAQYTPLTNLWRNISATYDGYNLKLYDNGILVGSNNNCGFGNPLRSSLTNYLGRGFVNSRFFNGSIDDVTLYNRALNPSEIQQIFTLGQTTYLWSNGATTPTINVSPTATTTYTCTVTTNGVSCTDSVTVIVSNPVIDLGADVTVCGTSTTLTAPSGYDSYLWSNGGTTNTTTVTANGTYSCAVTQGGCSATDSIDVTLIDATITASDTIICAGETVNLGVMNCPSLSGGLDNGLVGFWPFCGNANDESGNNFDGVVAAANLTADRFGSQNSAYQLNGANSQISTPFLGILGGNSRTISFWADVDPFVSELTVIQYGSSSSANGGSDRFGCKFANNGTPSVGIDIDGSQVTYAFPNLFNGWHLFTYTFSSSDVNSINNVRIYADGNLLTTLTQNYIPFPAAGVLNTTADLPLTFGGNQYNNVYYNGFLDDVAVYNRALSTSEIQELYTLNSSSFEWSNGATTPTINVSPTSTTIYTCTVTTNGVSCADSVTVVVSQPVASITPNGIVEICQGQSIALTANGGVSYLWNTGAPTQSITVNTEAVYTVTVTDANGCTDTESQLVKVNFLPNIGVNNASICPGQSTTLTATGGLSYVWSPATGLSSTTGTTVTASPSTSTVYTVTGTGANGCTNTATAAVTVNAAPTATITPATATTFCQGGSVVLNANTGTGLTYQWFNNAAAITGATTSSYTANASGSYIVVVTNTSTCSATSAATVVTVNALPIATITAATATTFCQGGSVVLNANTGTGLTYQWRLNGTNITGATTSTYTANASGSYTVVVTNTSTCSATSTATVVTVNALPTATITPATATTFCQGGSVVLNANTGTGLSYQWYNNTGIISGATSASYTANASGSYTVVVTNTSTCSATSTATVVTVNALPTATITPATSTTFCQGGSVVLNANTGTGLSYQWRLNGTNITGATSASYTANASGSYTVVVTNTSTCSATSAATVVTVNALPTATITPATATTFCQGGSVVLNANTGTGLSYQWFNNAVAISGATSSSYTANASGSFTVVVTNTSTCSSTSTATVVTVNALPTATITPATATTFCQGGSVVLNANTGAGLTYQWRLNGTNITGATSSSYTANASGSYTVVVTNTSTCSATSTATVVTVNALPTATITASSATTFCQGGSVLLNANTGTGLTYQWRLNGTNITGATTSSYTANASGSYTVVVTNTSTCSATSTATVVTVNALPTATITAATATTFCQGGSVVLNANTGTGLSYQWFNNAAAISGATSSSYTANASGSFTVVVTNTSTCSSTSTATVVTVNALPTATITAATATTFCQGGSVVLNANTGAGLTYQWRLNGTNITGATSSSYTANASGSYTVVVTNTSTCSATSTATVVTVNVLPTATITPATATTFCQGGSVVLNANTGSGLTYQWYNNATIISGATSSSYTANASGSFTVVVTNTSTCSATSTAIDVTAVPNVDYFADTDGDGFGDITTLISTCVQPQGYVTDNTDCKDNDAAIFPGTQEICNDVDDDCNDLIDDGLVFITCYADADGDSFGDINNPLDACLIPDGYVTNNTDCNDNDANQNNSSIEICNGEDDDCDGQIDNGLIFLDYYADLDSDGFGAGAATNSCVDLGAGYVTNNSDCNDNNANQNVASIEICNGEDDDCDGAIDNGLIFLDYYADLDSDGFGSGAATNSCVDLGAGYVTNNTDCNNATALINPNATEICNSIDDNCDGQIDEGITFTTYYQDFDNDGFGTGDAVTSCTNPGAGWVTNNTDCDDTNGNTNPNATETCNSIDDNCDGQIDEGVQTVYFIDNDGDTYGNPSVSILACTQPIGYTPDDTDCNDNDANINPGAEDIGGNGIDENCDGEIDNSIFELNAAISLYPNPTRSELNIQVNSSVIGSDVYIFDAVGKLVFKQQLLSAQTTIPVSNFADGNYVVRIGEVVKRFVVEK